MPDYLRDCYDGAFMLKNMGFLMLVSPRYFDFATKLLTVISKAFTQEMFKKRGDEVFEKGNDDVSSHLEDLTRDFLMCCSHNTPISRKDKLTVLNIIVTKTMRSWYKSELKEFCDANTKRRGKHNIKAAFRTELHCKTKGNEIVNKKKLEESFKKREQSRK